MRLLFPQWRTAAFNRSLVVGFVLVLVNHASAGMLGSSLEAYAKFHRELRHRQLFAISEAEGWRFLATNGLSSDERLAIAVELVTTLSEDAAYTSGTASDPLWEQVDRVFDETGRLLKGRALRELRLQQADRLIDQANLRYWEAISQRYDIPLREQALSDLTRFQQEALRLLEASGADSPKSENANDGFRTAEIQRLERELPARLVLLGLQQLELTEPTQPARAERIAEVESRLKKNRKPDLSPGLQALRLRGFRLQNRIPEAQALLAQIQAERDAEPLVEAETRDLGWPLLAEELQLLLAQGRADQLLLRLKGMRKGGNELPFELRWIEQEAAIALRDFSLGQKQPDLAAEWHAYAERLSARQIQAGNGVWKHRFLWGRKELLAGAEAGQWAARLSLAAVSLKEANRVAEGLAALDQLRSDPRYASLPDSVRRTCEQQTANLLAKSGDAEKTARMEFDLAQLAVLPEEAAQHHWRGCLALASQYRQQPTEPTREAYEKSLENHRAKYPSTSTGPMATYWLARIHEQRLQLRKAIPLYQELLQRKPVVVESLAGLSRCWWGLADREADRPEVRSQIAQRALEELTPLLPVPAEEQRKTLGFCETVLYLAKLQLMIKPPSPKSSFARWQTLAREVLEDCDLWLSNPGEGFDSERCRAVRRMARGILPRLQFHSGEPADDLPTLEQLIVENPLEATQMLFELASEDLTPQTSPEWGRAIDRLLRRTGPDFATTNETRAMYCRLIGLFSAGDFQAATQLAERLMNQLEPQSPVRGKVAQWCSGRPQAPLCEIAIKHAQRWEQQHSPGSDLWLAARAGVLRELYLAGRVDEARRLWGLTRSLYPNLGGPVGQAQFSQIEVLLKAESSKP